MLGKNLVQFLWVALKQNINQSKIYFTSVTDPSNSTLFKVLGTFLGKSRLIVTFLIDTINAQAKLALDNLIHWSIRPFLSGSLLNITDQ